MPGPLLVAHPRSIERKSVDARYATPRVSDDIPKPVSSVLRVAVVQLDYHPAYRNALGVSCLEEPMGADPHLQLSPDGVPPRELGDLRTRISREYAAQLARKVEAILRWCQAQRVRLVVFPEYAIPAELLPQLAAAVENMTVVAGSHLVDRAALSSKVYQFLGAAAPPLGTSVSPVLHGGKVIALVPKVHASPVADERKVLVPGADWKPVELPARPETMGVTLCIDFVDQEAPEVKQQIALHSESVRFWVVPSLTSITDDFHARAVNQVKRAKRPVFYANIATPGESSIFVDERAVPSPFPNVLPSGNEGLIVADVDLSLVPKGRSTGYADTPAATWVATPSLVYSSRTSESAYANWLLRVDSALSLGRSEIEALERATALIPELENELLSGSSFPDIRRRRLDHLIATADTVTRREQVRALVGDVVLPPEVLSPDHLRATLALASAAVLRMWRDKRGSEVNVRLAQLEAEFTACGNALRVTHHALSAKGYEAQQAIEQAVRGGAPRFDAPGELQSKLEFYVEVVEETYRDAYERAHSAFKAERFNEAKRELDALVQSARTRLVRDGDGAAPRWLAKFLLLSAVTCFNLQKREEAVGLLSQIEVSLLEPRQRLTVAEMLAEFGDVHHARSLLESVSPDDSLAEHVAHAKQMIELSSGSMPDALLQDPGVLLKAAQLMLTVGELDRAASLAQQVVELEPESAFLCAVATVVLLRSIERTAQPDSPGLQRILTGKRGALIELAENWLQKFAPENARPVESPDPIAEAFDSARTAFYLATRDLDALATVEVDNDPEAEAARERARHGDVQGALDQLPRTGSDWLDGLQHADLIAISGNAHDALEFTRQLAKRFPENASVQSSLAQRLLQAGHPQEALVFAKRAEEQVPSKGYRHLLAGCMIGEGRPSEAWAVLEQYKSTGGVRILTTLAELAGDLHPNEAVELWARLIERSPQDWRAKVALALAQRAVSRTQLAADSAWTVVEGHWDELTLEALATCAKLQAGAASLEQGQERAAEIARILHRRFPGDARAHLVRLVLRLEQGAEADLPPEDYALMTSAGLLHTLPVEQIPEMIERKNAWYQTVTVLYQAGGISLEGLGRSLNRPLSELVVDFFDENNANAVATASFVCAPILLDVSAQSLTARELLFGTAELLMLTQLGLATDLRRSVQAAGATVLVASSAWNGLRREKESSSGAAAGVDLAKKACELVLNGERQGWLRIVADTELTAAYLGAVPDVPSARDESLQEVLSEPLSVATQMAIGTIASPRRWRVSTDFFATWSAGHPRNAQGLAWRDAAHYLEVSKVLRAATAQTVSLPALVRLFLPTNGDASERRIRALAALARAGFPDAWTAEDLLVLAQKEPTLHSLVREVNGVEHMARHGDTYVSDAAHLQLSILYGDAIASAFLRNARNERPVVTALSQDTERPAESGKALLPPDHAKLLTGTLLARIERLDASNGTLLERVLSDVASRAIHLPWAAVAPVPIAPGIMQVDQNSSAGRMWGALQEWVGPTGRRHAAFGRALRDAWCLLDNASGESGPSSADCASLVLAGGLRRIDEIQGNVHAPQLDTPEAEALAILSANWVLRPLQDEGITTDVSEQTEPTTTGMFSWESLFTAGARELEAGTVEMQYSFTERFMTVRQPIVGTNAALSTRIPVEAAVLRVAPEASRAALGQLKRRQGRHDGHAYTLLEQLEREPANVALRRKYARHTANALWRLVRDDPAYLARWPKQRPVTGDLFRPTLETLLELLHEPIEPLGPNAESSIVLRDRFTAWQALDQQLRAQLLNDATYVPGGFLTLTVARRAANSTARNIEASLWHLENPEVVPASILASDIMVLGVTANKAPIVELERGKVDLRELLPKVFAKLLEAMQRPASSAGTMARDEPALLQVCSVVCDRLLQFQPGRAVPDWLWLTYRLHGWLCNQLAALDADARIVGIRELAAAAPTDVALNEPADMFNPLSFATRSFDYRLMVVLFALGAVQELAEKGQDLSEGAEDNEGVAAIGGPGIEKQLLTLAAQPPSELPVWGSWLAWNVPDNVPDLALWVVLRMNSERILDLPEGALSGRVERWPNAVETLPEGAQNLIELLVHLSGQHASALSTTVRRVLEDKLGQLESSPLAAQLQWRGLTGLFAAGALHLQPRVRSLVQTHLNEPGAAEVVERYLHGIGDTTERLQAEVLALHEHWLQSDTSRTVLTIAVGRLVVHSVSPLQERASATLHAMARHEYFRDDSQLKQLVQNLNLHEVESTP